MRQAIILFVISTIMISTNAYADECNEHLNVDFVKGDYIGCYTDDPDRDLIFHGRGFDLKSCPERCSMYIYFAIQDGSQCFCGNSYGTSNKYYKVSDSECSGTEHGPHGGKWRNEIYKVKREESDRRMEGVDEVCKYIMNFVSTSNEIGDILEDLFHNPGTSNIDEIEEAADIITESCTAAIESGNKQLVQCYLYVGLAKTLAPEHLATAWLSMYGNEDEASEACGNVVREVNRQLRGNTLPNVDVVTYDNIDGLRVQDCALLDQSTCELLEDFRVCKWSPQSGCLSVDELSALPFGLQRYRTWMTRTITALGATATAAAAVLASLCKSYDHALPAPAHH